MTEALEVIAGNPGQKAFDEAISKLIELSVPMLVVDKLIVRYPFPDIETPTDSYKYHIAFYLNRVYRKLAAAKRI